jgi:hypothetical protein
MPKIEYVIPGLVFPRIRGPQQLYMNQDTMPVDGWVTEIGITANSQSSSTSGHHLLLYDTDARLFLSGSQTWGTNEAMRTATLSAKVAAGKTLYWGTWSAPGSGNTEYIVDDWTGHHVVGKSTGTTSPTGDAEPFDGAQGSQNHAIDGYLQYIAQANPGVGVWQSPSPTGLITTSTPTFKGTTPHPNGDGAHDYTDTVHLKVYNRDTNVVYFDQQFATTTAERNGDYFEKTPTDGRGTVSLPAGVNAAAEFRHRDTWGAWSGWSTVRNFEISPGPDPSDVTRPLGRVNYRNQAEYLAQGGSGNLYRGTYNNTSGAALHSVSVEVWDRARTTRYKSSGWVNASAASGIWTLAEWSGHGLFDYGGKYSVRAKVREDNGSGSPAIEAPWGPWADFNVNALPLKPTNLVPGGGTATSALDFVASVSDPDGDAITAALMRITRIADSTAIKSALARVVKTNYTSGDMVRASTTGNGYRYKALQTGRSSDIANGTLVWPTTLGSSVKDIPTTAIVNSTTYALGVCRIRRGTTSGTQTLWYEATAITTGTVAATEPAAFATATNGQTITDGGVTWTVRTAINWQNAGEDTTWDMTIQGGTANRTIPSGFLTFGEEYYWEVQASDAIGYGSYSDRGIFVFAQVPNITMLSPRETPARRNPVLDPSFEDTSVSWWTLVGGNATNTSTVSQGGAAEGENFQRFSVDGTATSNTFYLATPKIAVDATWSRVIQAQMRKLSGTAAVDMVLKCYNASNTLVGTIRPASLRATNGADVQTYWQTYGGVVWPIGSGLTPAFPAATTQYEIWIYPKVSGTGAAVVDVDAILSENLSVHSTQAQADLAAKWYGYFDGSSSFSDVENDSAYYWEDVTNFSISQGIHVLNGVGSKIHYRYASDAALNQNAARLSIDQWLEDEQQFQRIYDSGMVLNTVTPNSIAAIDFPQGVVKSHGRYRLQVTVRDTALISKVGPEILFDVDYIGPPELTITLIEANPDRGTITISHDASALTSSEFTAYDYAVSSPEEPLVVFHRERNQARTTQEYPWPIHNRNYRVMVRQVQHLLGEDLEGRYSQEQVTCSYPGIFFLKDPNDPSLILPISVKQGQNPTLDSTPSSFASYRPYEEARRVHFGAEAMDSQESYIFEAWDTDEKLQEYIRVAEDFRARPRTLMILAQRPEEKFAVYPRKIARLRGSTPLYAQYTFEFEESSFTEDVFKRGAE